MHESDVQMSVYVCMSVSMSVSARMQYTRVMFK